MAAAVAVAKGPGGPPAGAPGGADPAGERREYERVKRLERQLEFLGIQVRPPP